MSIRADVQTLDPGPQIVLFQLDATGIGGSTLEFQGMQDTPIVWRGVSYDPWPISAEGFELTTEQQPRPTLSVGNLNGAITLLCSQFDDLVGAIVRRRRTHAQYLDGQPGADPSQEYRIETWFIERKSIETSSLVQFELSSALNFADVKLPRRLIIANQCPFAYRGSECNYTGAPVADELDVPTSNPLKDRCGKRLQSCKLRDWPDDVLNYGGYLAAGLVRT